jgi:hypothetical protein
MKQDKICCVFPKIRRPRLFRVILRNRKYIRTYAKVLKIKNIASIPVAAILVTSFPMKIDATTIAISIKAPPMVYVAMHFFVRRVR